MAGRGHGEKMTRKMTEAVAALMTTASVGAAAERCGVAASTLERWIKQEPVFQAEYREAKRQVLSHSLSLLIQVASRAVATLHAVMADPEAPASARVSAARSALELGLRAIELEDLEQRVAALETRGVAGLTGRVNGAQRPEW